MKNSARKNIFSSLLLYILLDFFIAINGQSSVSNGMDSQICTTKNGIWFTSEKSYFVVHFFKMNWFQANIYCKSLGMELLSIESNAEQELIGNILIDEGVNSQIWTSGSDLGEQGVWSWMATGRAFTYKNWTPGQPDNSHGKERCMELWTNNEPNSTKRSWNDNICEYRNHFICEKYNKTLNLCLC